MTAKHRLHPLSPILRGITSLWVVIAAISWQGFARFGITTGAIIVGASALVVLAWSWISWYFTGYTISNNQLHISDGVTSRRHRTIPLERVQSVEIVRPFLARVVGLAEVRCEVVGTNKTEAPLAYLALNEAHALQKQLLAISRQAGASPATHSDDTTTTESNTRSNDDTQHADIRVPTKRLLISQLLSPEMFLAPFGVAATIGLFVWQPDMSFIGFAGLITASLGLLIRPLRQAETHYRFTLRHVNNELRISRGLLDKSSQTLPDTRVTAISITRPILWRAAGWVHVRAAYAGQSRGRGENLFTTLLPVGYPADALDVYHRVIPSGDLLDADFQPVPAKARWCAPWQWRQLGISFETDVFVTRTGRFRPIITAIPYGRIQSIRIVQSRLQRFFGLATVHVDLAGAIGIATSAPHRSLADALAVASKLRAQASYLEVT